MDLTITPEDMLRLKPETKEDLFANLMGRATATPPAPVAEPVPNAASPLASAFRDLPRCVKLSVGQIGAMVRKAHPANLTGMRLIAESPNGIVHIDRLRAVGLDQHFASSMTKMARSLTGDRNARFVAWDNQGPKGSWSYAVPAETHRALREYFETHSEAVKNER